MRKNKIIFITIVFTFLYSCTSGSFKKVNSDDNKQYFASSGFALIYDDSLYEQKILNKRLNNENILLMHNTLKTNLSIKITNPINLKSIKTKVYKNANYPKIFNVVISKKIASILELDIENPFVEIIEIKKNKTFVAKKSNTFDEEKNVAAQVPVNEVEIGNELFYYIFDGEPVPDKGYINLSSEVNGLGVSLSKKHLKDFNIIS